MLARSFTQQLAPAAAARQRHGPICRGIAVTCRLRRTTTELAMHPAPKMSLVIRTHLLLICSALVIMLVFPALARNPPAAVAIEPRFGVSRWVARFESNQAELRKRHPAVVFYGDSNVERMLRGSRLPDANLKAIWTHYYGSRNALNLGYGGDTTGNLRWRIEHGEATGIAPKLAVVMIGTNDLVRGQASQSTAKAIAETIAALRQRLSATTILLLGILPSHGRPDVTARANAVNTLLEQRFGAAPDVLWFNTTPVYASRPLDTLFADALHLNAAGFAAFAAAIEPVVARTLGDAERPAPSLPR